MKLHQNDETVGDVFRQIGKECGFTRGTFSGTPELRRQRHSFNWPYDFFSIVELVKLEGKVDIFDSVPTTTDSEPIGEE